MAIVNNLSTGKPIGTVKALIGTATATDANGVTRTLQIGDKVYENDIINASAAGGTIHIEFTNNSFATLASGQSLTLDNTVFAAATEAQAPQQNAQDVQVQIAEGLDPTLIAEAAAAGATGGGGADGGHQFVIVDQNAARGEVTPGFETSGVAAQSTSAADNPGVGARSASGVGTEKQGEDTTPVTPPVPPAPEPELPKPPIPPAPVPEPPVPPAPEPEGDTYNARAVIYTAESGSANSVTLTGLKAGGDAPVWKNEAVKNYFNVTRAGDDTVTITLNAAGRAALLSGDLDPYSYLEIVGGDGKTYVVQVILDQDNSFNSAAENSDTTHGASLASGGLVYGEWHSGKDFTLDSSAINPSSDLGDQVAFSGNLSGATINTARGDDTIAIGGQMKGGSTILASGEAGNRATDDTNTVTVKGGMAAAAGETNLIQTNAGTVDIGTSTTQTGMSTAGGGQNIIEGGSGNTDVRVTATGTGMLASDGGKNEITNARDVAVNVESKSGDSYAIRANKDSSNIINADGSIDISAQSKGTFAKGVVSADGETLISSTGDVSIKSEGALSNWGVDTYTSATNASKTTIEGASVSVDVDASGYTSGDTRMGVAHGVVARGPGGETTITSRGDINVGTQGASSRAVWATDKGINVLTADGKLIVDSKATSFGESPYAPYVQPTGIEASSGGQNLITAGAVDVSVRGIHTAGTNVPWVRGVTAMGSSGNVIRLTGNDESTIKVSSTNDSSTSVAETKYQQAALYASGSGGSNIIEGATEGALASGKVTLAANADGKTGEVNAMYASSSGSNVLRAQEVNLSVSSETGNARGMFAESSGKNTITAGAVDINSTGGSGAAYGIYGATSAGNTVHATGNVAVAGTSGAGYAYGLFAASNAINIIRTTGGNVSIVADMNVTRDGSGNIISWTSSGTGQAYGTYAAGGGTNTIAAAGTVDILAASAGGSATGLYASTSGLNAINAGGLLNVMASSDTGTAYGLQAVSGGINRVQNQAGDITLTSTSANGVHGMHADKGKNVLDASGNITVNAISTNSYVYGLQSVGEVYDYSTSNTLTAGGAIAINVKAKTSANGLEANFGNESNILRAGSGITLTVEGDNALGIRNGSRDGETTLTTKTGDVTLDIKATGETAGLNNATGIITGGTTELTAESGNVIVGATSALGRADAVYTVSMGKTTLTASDLADIQAQGATGARGLYVESQNPVAWAQNVIDAGKVNIVATTTGGTAQGIYNLAGGNIVHAAGDIDIAAASMTGTAYGVYAEKSNSKYGENIVTSDTGALNITASGAEAHGIFAGPESAPSNPGRGGGINTISAETVNVDVSTTGASTGLNAKYGGSNEVSAREVNLNVSSETGDAHGMSVMSAASKNTVSADKVSIETKSDEGNAYAMKATQGGVNTIQAGTDSAGIEVRLAVEAGHGQAAYAMYAQGASSVNKIIGTEGNDTISLKGDIKAESGGKNIIITGNGTNTLDLEGMVSTGSLTLQTGVDGKDILILRADNAADFKAYYQTWLNEVKTSGINIIGIDVIIGGDATGSNVNAADFVWLEGLFGSDTVHYGVQDYTEAAPMMAAVADSLDDYKDTSTGQAGANDQSAYVASEGDTSTATLITTVESEAPLAENATLADQPQAEPGQVETTASDISEAALAGEAALETVQQSPHHILLADDITLPESVTYDSLVDAEGNIDLDAIHSVKTLLTSEAHHELHAGENGDILFGAAGDDILIAGPSDDILVSGTGQTTFVYEQGDLDHVTSGDKIIDFKLGEDVLDISDLLAGADKPGSVSELVGQGFLNFDKITQNEDGTTTIKLSIDTDGSAGHEAGAGAVPLAEMTVYGLNLGSDPTANDVLEQLVNNGSIQF